MKRTLSVLISAFMCIAMVSCGSEYYSEDAYDKEQENDSDDYEDSSVNEEAATAYDPIRMLVDMETVTVDGVCEYYVEYAEITDDVLPPSPERVYSHYEADEGKTYVDICVAYKNLDVSDVDADEVISGRLVYADKYEYRGFSIIEEDNRSDFTYSNITSISPLTTEYLHYLFEVPDEVQSSDASVTAYLTIGESEFGYLVKDGGNTVQPTVGSEKSDGAVKLGEIIVTENSEFFVDYSAIEKDIVPPVPSRVYSHYEAENGKMYVDLCIGYRNLSSTEVDADEVITAEMKYDGKYEYKGFSIIEEDSRGDFTYTNITGISPLSTEYLHYLFEVPEEVASGTGAIVITFKIDGNTYSYTLR